jgi:hypothetical protein
MYTIPESGTSVFGRKSIPIFSESVTKQGAIFTVYKGQFAFSGRNLFHRFSFNWFSLTKYLFEINLLKNSQEGRRWEDYTQFRRIFFEFLTPKKDREGGGKVHRMN